MSSFRQIGGAAALAMLLATSASAPANAFYPFDSNTDIKYYWEVERPNSATYGWDSQPRAWQILGPVVRKRGESLYAFCARQVGRTLRTDESGLMRSTQLTDSCVRRGGRY